MAITLGGLPLRITITGPDLAERLFRPFRHLEVSHSTVRADAFIIEAWSQAETGVAIPELGVEPVPYSPDGNLCYRRQPNGRAVADRRSRRILAGFESAAGLSYSDLAKPFRSLLIPLLHDGGRQLIHGGMVIADPDTSGLLLAGRSGSGKSTVALSALAAGFGFLGDDHLAISSEGGRLVAHSLYATCGISAGHLANFPRLPGRVVSAPDRDKNVILLAPEENGRLIAAAPIGAVVMPVIVPGAETGFRRASRGETLRALIPGSISPRLPVLQDGRGWQFDGIGAIAARMPGYRLELGADLASIPPVLRGLAAELAASRGGVAE